MPFSLLFGRVLLWCTGVLLAVMPWTERFDWDGGFRGGQDFEFGLLGVLSALCLSLLPAHGLRALAKATRVLLALAGKAVAPQAGCPWVSHSGVLAYASPPAFSGFPLRI